MIMKNIEQRSIKFRAWDGKKMLFSENGDFYLMPNNEVDVPSSTGHEFTRHTYPVMQYTGYLDSVPEGLYEGDIVNYTTGLPQRKVLAVVMFGEYDTYTIVEVNPKTDEEAPAGDIEQHTGFYLECQETKRKYPLRSLAIRHVGNIYQHPNLLTTQPRLTMSTHELQQKLLEYYTEHYAIIETMEEGATYDYLRANGLNHGVCHVAKALFKVPVTELGWVYEVRKCFLYWSPPPQMSCGKEQHIAALSTRIQILTELVKQ